jgi:hypothetical protein
MEILGSVASAAEFMATSQTNNLFFLVKSPLFMQFLDICVLKYPDSLSSLVLALAVRNNFQYHQAGSE